MPVIEKEFYNIRISSFEFLGFLLTQKPNDFEGKKFSPYQHRILATNGLIHDEMLEVIHNTKQL